MLGSVYLTQEECVRGLLRALGQTLSERALRLISRIDMGMSKWTRVSVHALHHEGIRSPKKWGIFYYYFYSASRLLPKLDLHTFPTAVDQGKIVINTVKVTILDHGEALQEADGDI